MQRGALRRHLSWEMTPSFELFSGALKEKTKKTKLVHIIPHEVILNAEVAGGGMILRLDLTFSAEAFCRK